VPIDRAEVKWTLSGLDVCSDPRRCAAKNERQCMKLRLLETGIFLTLFLAPFTSAQIPSTPLPSDPIPDSPGTVQARLNRPQALTPGPAQARVNQSVDAAPAQTPSVDASQVKPESSNASQDRPTGVRPDARQSASSQGQETQNTPHQPVGTAVAETIQTTGIAAARPVGAAVAPGKQRRTRSILIKVGSLVGVGVAVGTTIALSQGSPSRPPGSH
jgi:hypothetical protein